MKRNQKLESLYIHITLFPQYKARRCVHNTLLFADEVCQYFGVKIAMYFAYLGHYTTALTIPTSAALLFWLISGQSQVRVIMHRS